MHLISRWRRLNVSLNFSLVVCMCLFPGLSSNQAQLRCPASQHHPEHLKFQAQANVSSVTWRHEGSASVGVHGFSVERQLMSPLLSLWAHLHSVLAALVSFRYHCNGQECVEKQGSGKQIFYWSKASCVWPVDPFLSHLKLVRFQNQATDTIRVTEWGLNINHHETMSHTSCV